MRRSNQKASLSNLTRQFADVRNQQQADENRRIANLRMKVDGGVRILREQKAVDREIRRETVMDLMSDGLFS